MSTNIGKKIRIIRESERLTRDQFADLTGIPASAQKFYETGRVESIGSETLIKITTHPQFTKYTLWLMTGKTNETAGQIAPSLSPDGQKRIKNLLKASNVGK
ncbi:helix-turn-helix transcriptional regulator [Arsenophonus sp. aPb]|uniref:helix-turn-helix domain-containing protein n=1 Tax=Arsenophonus sp. aPb TaxID=3041619 RepID=UPI0024686535|nr:helix-turn-helix transcriptional regulator [Arsenophonus sp. aPb]WGL98639.1 helix-turn-helix transcriptional regulator [Arsenophonus sp. aPb]